MFLQSFPDYSKSFGSPKLYLLSRNEIVARRSKQNKCRPHWLFYVVDGTRTAVKCTKMKIARAKRARLDSRPPACLSSIIIILVRSDCDAYSRGRFHAIVIPELGRFVQLGKGLTRSKNQLLAVTV